MRLHALSCRGPETVKISLAVVCVPGRVSLCVCVYERETKVLIKHSCVFNHDVSY